MLSQWVLVAALVLVGLYLLKAKRSANQQAIRRLFIVVGLIAGFVAVLFPEYTNVVAGSSASGEELTYFFTALLCSRFSMPCTNTAGSCGKKK